MRPTVRLAVGLCLVGCGASEVEVFPEGQSTWTGSFAVASVGYEGVLDLTRDGSELEGEVELDFMGTPLTLGLRGMVDLATHQVALVPLDWVGTDPGVETLGVSGVYDPATGTLSGTTRDAVSWESNTPDGGPFLMETDGSPAVVASDTLPGAALDGPVDFSGTFRCTSTERAIEGTLTPNDEGRIEAVVSFSESDGASVGTFEMDGVATDGRLSLLPLPWIEDGPADTSYLNFFLDGRLAADGYVATLTQNVGAVCEANGLDVAFD